MTGIFGTPPVQNTSMYTGTTTESGTVGKAELGKDAFLNLLVAQLKYQDPSSPTDSSQFMAQTAQFTMVEKMEELAKSQTAMVNAQNLASATSLVGRQISWTDGTATKSGVVTAVTMNNGTAQLSVGDLTVDLAAVTKVAPAGTPTTATGSTGTPGTAGSAGSTPPATGSTPPATGSTPPATGSTGSTPPATGSTPPATGSTPPATGSTGP